MIDLEMEDDYNRRVRAERIAAGEKVSPAGCGTITSIFIVLMFAGFAWVDDEWVKTAHRWWGTATAAWAVLILASCARTHREHVGRGVFRLALFAGALLVSVTGFLGGSLLYGLDHLAW